MMMERGHVQSMPTLPGFPPSTWQLGSLTLATRYRYDEASRTRIKTVELIVEKKQLPALQKIAAHIVTVDDDLVPVRISYGERDLGKMAKAMGGKWDPDVKLWYIRFGKIKGTELEKHIILDASAKTVERDSI